MSKKTKTLKKLNPLNDFIFQKLFGEQGQEAELLSLLNAILYDDVKGKLTSLEILENKTLVGEMIGDKTGILDIRAVTDKASHVNVEVQRKDYGNMDTRSPFYWSLQFTKSIKRGEDYVLLPKIIAINILDFDFFPLPPFHTTYHLREDTYRHFILTDVMELHYIEMPKFRRLVEKDFNNPLHRWLAFFNKNISEEELKKLTSMDTAIKRTAERMKYLASDEETLRVYQTREMALFDYRSGVTQVKKDIAKKMLKRKTPIEIVAEDTGLEEFIVLQLQKELA